MPMTDDAESVAREPEIHEARKALHCLALEVEPSIQRDVSSRVEAAFVALKTELEAAQTAAREAREMAQNDEMNWVNREGAIRLRAERAEAQVAALRAQLWKEHACATLRDDGTCDGCQTASVLSNTEAAAASLLAREREKEREACAQFVEQSQPPSFMDDSTYMEVRSGFHNATRTIAAAIRARSEP